MDELKIKSTFMRGTISKILESILCKKFGYKVDISINDIDAVITDGKAHIHVDLDGEINTNELGKFKKLIGGERP